MEKNDCLDPQTKLIHLFSFEPFSLHIYIKTFLHIYKEGRESKYAHEELALSTLKTIMFFPHDPHVLYEFLTDKTQKLIKGTYND